MIGEKAADLIRAHWHAVRHGVDPERFVERYALHPHRHGLYSPLAVDQELAGLSGRQGPLLETEVSGQGALLEAGVSGQGALLETGVSGQGALLEAGASGRQGPLLETEVSGQGTLLETELSGQGALLATGVSGQGALKAGVTVGQLSAGEVSGQEADFGEPGLPADSTPSEWSEDVTLNMTGAAKYYADGESGEEEVRELRQLLGPERERALPEITEFGELGAVIEQLHERLEAQQGEEDNYWTEECRIKRQQGTNYSIHDC